LSGRHQLDVRPRLHLLDFLLAHEAIPLRRLTLLPELVVRLVEPLLLEFPLLLHLVGVLVQVRLLEVLGRRLPLGGQGVRLYPDDGAKGKSGEASGRCGCDYGASLANKMNAFFGSLNTGSRIR
jgi:hypothetical protein